MVQYILLEDESGAILLEDGFNGILSEYQFEILPFTSDVLISTKYQKTFSSDGIIRVPDFVIKNTVFKESIIKDNLESESVL